MLPQQKKPKSSENPERLLLFAHPKCGKTTALSGLENCLIIDLENGTEYVEALVINVLKEVAKEMGLLKPLQVLNSNGGLKNILKYLHALSQELKQGVVVYDYIAIDTTTALLDIATELATLNYKNTVIGKNYTGNDVVRDLPNGGGYYYLRESFQELISWFEPYAKKGFILVSHTKDASVIRDGRDLNATDIALPGKLKSIICQYTQAIGHLRRVDGTKTVVSFKSDERDLASGARPIHLANKEFVLVEENPAGSREFTFHWDKIYLPD